MFVGIGLIVLPATVIAYKRINKQRDFDMQVMGGVTKLSPNELRELGDRAPDFRYIL